MLSKLKSGETRERVQSGDDPTRWVGTFFNLGLFFKWVKINLGLGNFLKWNDTLKLFRNQLNMKNIGTKSVNMSDLMIYLAMLSTTIDKILCFLKMNMSHYLFSLWYSLELSPPPHTGL